jgi:hypothetical protein
MRAIADTHFHATSSELTHRYSGVPLHVMIVHSNNYLFRCIYLGNPDLICENRIWRRAVAEN